MGPTPTAAKAIEVIKIHRRELGLSWEGFSIQAQAQYSGGNPDKWARHADKWSVLGATHLAIATHNAGKTDVDGHLRRIESKNICQQWVSKSNGVFGNAR